MNEKCRIAIWWTLMVVFCLQVFPQDKSITLEDIYHPNRRIRMRGGPMAGGEFRWMKTRNKLLQRKMDTATRQTQWQVVDPATGESEPLFDASRMEKAFGSLTGFSAADAKELVSRGSFQLSPGEDGFLIRFASDLYCYFWKQDKAVRLTHDSEEEQEAEFSPDERMVSFIRNSNVYVVGLEDGRERALTKGGTADILYGRLDWVYQEEVYGRGNYRAYWWSPDSTQIALLRIDQSAEPVFPVVNHLPTLQELEKERYPKAGSGQPKADLGIIRIRDGSLTWVDNFRYQAGEFLIVRVGWHPDSTRVVYQIQNRIQTWLDLNVAQAADGKSKTLFRETSPAWVEVIEEPLWLKDKSFLWLSDRSGYRHLYRYGEDGKLMQTLTGGKWDIASVVKADEKNGWIYFLSSEKGQPEQHHYRMKFSGGSREALSRETGWHDVRWNESADHFLDTWSNVDTPSQTRWMDASGALGRIVQDNAGDELKPFRLSRWEFLQVKNRDGFSMEAMLLKPADFQESKKYPVFCNVYAGPDAPSVANRWGGTAHLWYQMLAQNGYIIWICDNRSASGKGIAAAHTAYKRLGQTEIQDIEDGLQWLKKHSWIDGSRIGISGWSYGGYMTSYAMTHSKSFKVGIAGGSVTDWANYDSVYTERFMDMPQNNPEGYRMGSVVKAAKDLSGKILLLHGTMDDNVHLANTMQLVYELQKAGKDFALMLYPQSRHGVSDPWLAYHMRSLMTRFLLENL